MKESYFKCEGTGIIYNNLKNYFDFSNTISFKYIYDGTDESEDYYISITIKNNAKINKEEHLQFKEIEI